MVMFSSLYGERLSRELGTDDTVLFTTARRKAAINEAQVEFANATETIQNRIAIPVVGGTAEYDLNSSLTIPAGDYVGLAKDGVEFRYTDSASNVTILAGDDLTRLDIYRLNRDQPGWQLSTVASSVMQLPTTYYLRTDGDALYLGFQPVPSTGSSASATIYLTYLAQPTPLTSDSQQPFTMSSGVRNDLRQYHQGLVHFAASQLEKLRRDDQASDRQLQAFGGYVTRYLQGARIKGGRVMAAGRQYFKRRVGGWLDLRSVDPRVQ